MNELVSYIASYPISIREDNTLSQLLTIAAILVAIFTPFFVLYLQNKDLKRKIKRSLVNEIYANYYSIMNGGMMEVIINEDQLKAYESNLHIFTNKNINISTQIHQLYNLFKLYEFYWRAKYPNYTYFMYELKFKIKVEIIIFLEVIGKIDLNIRQILTDLLCSNALAYQFVVINKYEDSDIWNFIKGEKWDTYLAEKMNAIQNDDTRKEIVDLFIEYIDKKYNSTFKEVKNLIASEIKNNL